MNFDKVKAFMDYLTSWVIPGNTISIYHENKEVFRYSSGYSSLEEKKKMTGDELLFIYSCSKVTTAVAALQLYEKGVFLLDDPLYAYIPEFKEMYIKNADGNVVKAKNPITIRQLLSHTAGLTYNTNTENIENVRQKTNGRLPTLEVARAVAKDYLAYEPGTKWGYSLAHDILAAFVEAASGKRFSDYVKENIFDALGIKAYYHPTPELEAKMAEQYQMLPPDNPSADIVSMQASASSVGTVTNFGKRLKLLYGPDYDNGGAGIITDVPSYAKLASALSMGGLAPNGERILSRGTVELMRQNQLNAEQLSCIKWSQLTGYGYGLGVRTMIDRAKAGFNGVGSEFGWGGAAGATVLCDLDSGFSYFYAHHMLNPQESYYQPRLRNAAYADFYK